MAQRLAQVLYTHKAGGSNPSSPTIELETVLARGPFLFGPSAWDSNPTGCEAEETRSVFQRSTRGPQARSESGRRQPHATSLIAHHLIEKAPSDGGLSFLGPVQRDSNPPARLSQWPWPENGKNEYCYLAYNISEDNICLSYATYVHYKD